MLNLFSTCFLIVVSMFQTGLVVYLDELHGLSPIPCDTVAIFVYTDQLSCHCVFISCHCAIAINYLAIVLLLCTEDDNSCYRNVCKMSVVSFALAVVFIISVFIYSNFYRQSVPSLHDGFPHCFFLLPESYETIDHNLPGFDWMQCLVAFDA